MPCCHSQHQGPAEQADQPVATQPEEVTVPAATPAQQKCPGSAIMVGEVCLPRGGPSWQCCCAHRLGSALVTEEPFLHLLLLVGWKIKIHNLWEIPVSE